MGKIVRSWVVLVAAFLMLTTTMHAQCVVINEIMINGASSNDGSNAPNTEEWVELYNTCTDPADISCFVLTDGDFSVTFPTGTILSPGDHFVIGSDNSLVPIDFSWATCGCTAGSSVGIFTNGNEQLALLNENGGVEDAIVWGSGQFPVSIASSTLGSCSSISINIPNAGSDFEVLPGGGGQGCTLARDCDGSATWVERCGDTATANASNGSVGIPEFLADITEVCLGACISFTDDTPFAVETWSWTFEGALTTTSDEQNPQTICYNVPGTYDVTLTVTTACGTSTQTQPDYIVVSEGFVPSISPDGIISICPGDTQPLTSNIGNATAQWQLNGEDIPGATSDLLIAEEPGEYTININIGSCSASSEPTVIAIYDVTPPTVDPSQASLCDGNSVVLTGTPGYDFYQWTLNGEVIPDASTSSLEVSEGGEYGMVGYLFGCDVFSNEVTVNSSGVAEFALNVTNETLCPGEVINLQAPMGFESFQWYLDGTPIENANADAYLVLEEGTYSVEVFDFGGCSGFSQDAIIDFAFPETPEIDTDGGAFTFCNGQSIDLFLNGNFEDIQWYLDGVPVGNDEAVISLNDGGEVYVEATSNGCAIQSSPVMLEEIVVVAELNPSGTITTCGEFLTLTADPSGNIQWFINGNEIAGENGNTYDATQDGEYTFLYISPEGCSATSNATEVIFQDELSIAISASSTSFCVGDDAVLTVTGAVGDIIWSTGEEDASIVVTAGGTYSVEIVNAQGCVGNASIEVEMIPLPLVDAGNDTISDCSTGVMLSGSGSGTLEWSPAGSVSDANDPFALANPSITTTYVLTATIGNCSATDEVVVEVDCASIFIPNVMTPNGDGKNDVFKVISRGVKTFELKIFNRWGNLLYSSTDPDDVWDGGMNGYYVADGTYVWTVVALDLQNKPILDEDHSSGTLTVLR